MKTAKFIIIVNISSEKFNLIGYLQTAKPTEGRPLNLESSQLDIFVGQKCHPHSV